MIPDRTARESAKLGRAGYLWPDRRRAANPKNVTRVQDSQGVNERRGGCGHRTNCIAFRQSRTRPATCAGVGHQLSLENRHEAASYTYVPGRVYGLILSNLGDGVLHCRRSHRRGGHACRAIPRRGSRFRMARSFSASRNVKRLSAAGQAGGSPRSGRPVGHARARRIACTRPWLSPLRFAGVSERAAPGSDNFRRVSRRQSARLTSPTRCI